MDSDYYAVIATWEESHNTLTSTDPKVEGHGDTPTYSMTTVNVDYQEMVKGYTMPFEYLWALLLVGQEKEFALDLADLVYDSALEITILDSIRTNTNIITETYTERMKVHTYNVTIEGQAVTTNTTGQTGTTNSSNQPGANNSSNPTFTTTTEAIRESGIDAGTKEAVPQNREVVNTTVTITNTVDAIVSYADIWVLKMANEFVISVPDTIDKSKDNPQKPRPFPNDNSPDAHDNEDPLGLAAAKKAEVDSRYAGPNTVVSTSITSKESDYWFAKENWNINNRNIVNEENRIPGPKEIIKEKTDPDDLETNFVTLLRDKKHQKAAQNIYSAPEWIFDILEHNEETSDMVDLTKYLLYKASGKKYDGVDTFDYDLFNLDDFNYVGDINRPDGGGTTGGSGSGGNYVFADSGIDGVEGDIFDYLLARGVPAAGISAIVGNLEERVNNGEMTWEEAFESFKKTWDEIKSNNTELLDALMNAKDEEGLKDAAWKFAQYQGQVIGNKYDEDKIKQQVDNASKWYDEFLEKNPYATIGDGSNILYWAELTAKEMHEQGVKYSQEELEYYDAEKNADYYTMKGQDCGGYVASVLYKSGAVTKEEWDYISDANTGFHRPDYLVKSLKNIGWLVISPSEPLMPGDVVSNGEHAVIYAGGDECWDVYSGTGERGYVLTTRKNFKQFLANGTNVQIRRKPQN